MQLNSYHCKVSGPSKGFNQCSTCKKLFYLRDNGVPQHTRLYENIARILILEAPQSLMDTNSLQKDRVSWVLMKRGVVVARFRESGGGLMERGSAGLDETGPLGGSVVECGDGLMERR